jgi:GTPase SAR1 family protein
MTNQLVQAFAILQEYKLQYTVSEFKIPQKWHETKSIECLDHLRLIVTRTSNLQYDKYESSPEHLEDLDIKDLILNILGTPTCSEAAKFMYNVLRYTQQQVELEEVSEDFMEDLEADRESEVAYLEQQRHVTYSDCAVLSCQGNWDAYRNNEPNLSTLKAVASNKGHYYVVSTSGTETEIDGSNDWQVGDWIISNGTVWEKLENAENPLIPRAGEFKR